MPAYPIVRFVNSIAANPTIDLDLHNEQPFRVHADDFSTGVPAYAGDPLSQGVKWGYRTVTLAVQIAGGNSAALAAFSALAKQVTVDNLLMVQWDAAQPPVFYKTYKTQPSEIDMTNVFVQTGGLRPDTRPSQRRQTAATVKYVTFIPAIDSALHADVMVTGDDKDAASRRPATSPSPTTRPPVRTSASTNGQFR